MIAFLALRMPKKNVTGLGVPRASKRSALTSETTETRQGAPLQPEDVQEVFQPTPQGDKHPLWKRTLDLGCIILALPILIPLMSGIALLIFIVSPGPVFYLQERIGYRGRRFICIKFRTMKNKAEVDTHKQHLAELMRSNRPMVKMDAGDPRVIPLGRLLRCTGLDELPQLLNVLGAQMSLVGPRPCLPYEYDDYLPEEKRRFESWPGLTGLWQVSGKNNTTFSEMIALDIKYAQIQSLRTDLRIMFKTVPALVRQVREARARRRAAAQAADSAAAIAPAPISVTGAEAGGRLRGAELARYR
jgi:lipopolysaccharide/colanic/teichoic acid biosynthesis glycosyltransferase